MTERFLVFLADDDAVKCEVVPSSAYDQLLSDNARLLGLLQEALNGPGWQDEHWRAAAEDAVGGGR